MDYNYIKKRSGEPSKNPTLEEKIVREMFRNRKFHRMKFLSQHPIENSVDGKRFFFITDFDCAEKTLVLELDSKIHDRQQERDSERDMMKGNLDRRVFCIKNEEIRDTVQVKLMLEFVAGFSSSPSLLAGRGRGGE